MYFLTHGEYVISYSNMENVCKLTEGCEYTSELENTHGLKFLKMTHKSINTIKTTSSVFLCFRSKAVKPYALALSICPYVDFQLRNY